MIIVSDHGRKRLIKRLGIRHHKIDRFVHRVWNSKEPIDNRYRQKINKEVRDNRRWRQMMGYLFVFKETKKDVVLLTCLSRHDKHDHDWAKMRVTRKDNRKNPLYGTKDS